jgi:hypothetical protein
MTPLFVSLPDWQIPWAGIGALLMGTGSFLSGLAAYKAAMKRNNDPEPEDSSGDH